MGRLTFTWLASSSKTSFNLYTLNQLAIFAGPALVAILWLDTKGHYRQRLPYWESIGNIVTITLCGFVASGFIQFAIKDPSSRLWMGISWVLFGIMILLSRTFVRRGLDRSGEMANSGFDDW